MGASSRGWAGERGGVGSLREENQVGIFEARQGCQDDSQGRISREREAVRESREIRGRLAGTECQVWTVEPGCRDLPDLQDL